LTAARPPNITRKSAFEIDLPEGADAAENHDGPEQRQPLGGQEQRLAKGAGGAVLAPTAPQIGKKSSL
jgi:hypothetical protein